MHEPLIRDLYAAFNARDIEAVIAHLDPRVDWPNAWEGGRLHGHAAVREYWTRQFAAIDGRVEPTEIVAAGDNVTVTVHQTVRDLAGQLQDERTVTHAYTFRDGRIVRMDVGDDPATGAAAGTAEPDAAGTAEPDAAGTAEPDAAGTAQPD